MKKQTRKNLSNVIDGLLILLAALCIFRTPLCLADTQPATIEDFFVTNSDSDLLLYLTVRNGFTQEMETGIQNGIPATYTYYVELYQTRKAWPDRKVSSHVIHRTVTYDNLKEEYSVIFSPAEKKITTTSLAEAEDDMSEINGYKIIPTSRLTANSPYLLRVRVRLAQETLPSYFHYLIPFSSLWDFETDWYSLRFTY